MERKDRVACLWLLKELHRMELASNPGGDIAVAKKISADTQADARRITQVCKDHRLLEVDVDGLRLTDAGRRFIAANHTG